MNLQHLTYFNKIVECGILSKAAEELFITPSALSRAIASLEEEVGVALFDKKGRNIILNRYGKVFYAYVKRAIMEINEGLNATQSMANILTGSIRVSSIFSVGTNFIPDLLTEFYKSTCNQNVKIELSQRPTTQILQDIINDELDIAFCGEFDIAKQYSEVNREAIYEEKMMLIVPENHRLSSKKEVSFDDIKDEVFIGYNNATGIVNTIYDAVARIGYKNFRFNTLVESNEDNNTTNLVKKGLGIAFVVDNPSIYNGGVCVLKLSDLHFFRTIYMVWKRDAYLSPAVKNFKQMVFVYKDQVLDKKKI